MAILAVLLLLMTRSGQTLWFSVVTVGLALLASAPELVLRPIVVSFLFFGATLFLLVRLPRKEGSYRLPIAIAILFWFWANLDAWFFIGPLTVALFLLGQWLQKLAGDSSENARPPIGNSHTHRFSGGRLYRLHAQSPSHPHLGIASGTRIGESRERVGKRS